MAASKINIRFNFGAFITYLLSFGFLLADYLIYSLLPESEGFTNSIEVSGEETVRAFMVAPVLGVVALIVFVAFLVVFRKYLKELSLADNKFGDKLIGNGTLNICSYASSVILAVMLVLSVAFSFAAFSKFNHLGFVAPVDGTVYESYEKFILADCVVHFIFFVLMTVKMAGFSIMDNIGSLFNKKEKKS